MTDASTPDKLLSPSNLFALGVGLVVLAAYQSSGNPFAFLQGDNLLEKALHVGRSDQTQMDAFKNAGGLDKDSSWKGFKVKGVSVSYDNTGKLGMAVLTLDKSFPRHKLASIDELQSAMTGECGNNWTQSNKFGAAVLEGRGGPDGLRCSALESGRQTVEVTLGR